MARKQKSMLTDWDWSTLVSSWRYYFLRGSIAASMFPGELVERYFGPKSKYTDEDRERIAHQFVNIDFVEGNLDYDTMFSKDESRLHDNREEYRKLWLYLNGYLYGFSKVVTLYKGETKTHDAFKHNGKWVGVDAYVSNPFVDMTICDECIVEIDGQKVGNVKKESRS